MSWRGFPANGQRFRDGRTRLLRRIPPTEDLDECRNRNVQTSDARKIGLLLNGIVGVVLAVPIVRYLVSPVTRERQIGYESWLSLGGLEQFPAGQTRLATYRNPAVNAWDGETADIACWVRNVDDQNFQVFAINCAHLGCPVRWFAQSSLFHVPLPRRRLLPRRFPRVRTSRTWFISVPLQNRRWQTSDQSGRNADSRSACSKLRREGSRRAPDPKSR